MTKNILYVFCFSEEYGAFSVGVVTKEGAEYAKLLAQEGADEELREKTYSAGGTPFWGVDEFDKTRFGGILYQVEVSDDESEGIKFANGFTE